MSLLIFSLILIGQLYCFRQPIISQKVGDENIPECIRAMLFRLSVVVDRLGLLFGWFCSVMDQEVVLLNMIKMQFTPHVTHHTNSTTPKLVSILFNKYCILGCHCNYNCHKHF